MNITKNNKIPTLVGLKEFADLLEWDKPKLGMKYSRQKSGRDVRNPLPEPVQVLAATPVWTKASAEEYKKSLLQDGD